MDTALEKLEPKEFFRWFFAIGQIPHGSGNEAGLIAFLQDFAAGRGIPCHTDAAGNVFMTVPATAGYEDQPKVLFQAHMDMVCEKEPEVEFDFTKDPIRMHIEGDKLLADRTTLGADNAVGMATMLALADGKDIPHPALELLFTAQEEVGLVGIRAFDLSRITARRMVNMDCGDSHVLCISSAGKILSQIRECYPEEALSSEYTVLELTVSGGQGGHAGLAANLGRACAANVLGELLSAVPLRLVKVTGSKAIMKTATAVIAVKAAEAEAVTETLMARMDAIRSIYKRTDPDICLEITPAHAERALSEADSHNIAMVLNLLRTGQSRADGIDQTIIISSAAIIALALEEGTFSLDYLLRSQYTADQELPFERACFLASSCGMTLTRIDSYEGWPERDGSAFREKFQQVHTRLFGREMELERAPGGVEVGIIYAGIPDMDAVGVAPTARGAHTTDEHLFISETAPYWELVKAVLAQKE